MPLIPSRNPQPGQDNARPRMHGKDDGTPHTVEEVEAAHIRRLLMNERDSAVRCAERIHGIIGRANRGKLNAVFGDDAAELNQAYSALKKFITTLDPNLEVPEIEE